MYVLYGGDYTRASLVRWLLDEAGIQYEFRRIDLLQGEQRSAEYLSLNPAGLVPVLITPEGDVLYEVKPHEEVGETATCKQADVRPIAGP